MAGNVVRGRLGPSFLARILSDEEKLQLAHLNALTVAHDDDGGVEFDPAWYSEPGQGDGCRKQGGPGVKRPDRLPPRPWQGLSEDGRHEEKRRRPHLNSPWDQRYIVAPPRGPAGGHMPSLAWDEFRFKFRTPYPMFSWLLQESRKVSMFLDETLRKDPMFTAMQWDTFDASGETVTNSGVRAINDGGYHQWRETMAGQKPDEAGTLSLAGAGAISE
eukprot:jgi/Tetstr1/464808/TSEL_009547.t1